jgi:proteic killer suppression protein
MILSFRSRALQRFWERNDVSKLPPDRVSRIAMLLDHLNASIKPSDMRLPGFGFHALSGDKKGRYAVSVSANWRITFAWDEEDAIEVGFEDYH